MPELPEVERYRRLAELALGRRVVSVEAPDPWYLKGGLTGPLVTAALVGRELTGARRIGKLLLLDTGAAGDAGLGPGTPAGPTLGLRFGMTGRLMVDGRAGVEALLRSSPAPRADWERFSLRFPDGGALAIQDPRRLGGVELDPDEARLGPDVMGLRAARLGDALAGSAAPLKARLLDQSRIAGVGNLLADEALWRAGLAPGRPAGGLSAAELRRLHRHLVATVEDLTRRGGSHTGDLLPARRPGGRCPKDGAELSRATIGGRTTWWCPRHQH